MIACLSPGNRSVDYSLNTLYYASMLQGNKQIATSYQNGSFPTEPPKAATPQLSKKRDGGRKRGVKKIQMRQKSRKDEIFSGDTSLLKREEEERFLKESFHDEPTVIKKIPAAELRKAQTLNEEDGNFFKNKKGGSSMRKKSSERVLRKKKSQKGARTAVQDFRSLNNFPEKFQGSAYQNSVPPKDFSKIKNFRSQKRSKGSPDPVSTQSREKKIVKRNDAESQEEFINK